MISQPLGWLSTVVSLGGNIAGVVPGGQAVGTGLGFASTGLGFVSSLISAPDNPSTDPKYLEQAYEEISKAFNTDQQGLAGIGDRSDADLWMAARATQLANPTVTGAAYGPDGSIRLATGYGGGQGAAHVVTLSDEDITNLQHSTYPNVDGADGPYNADTQAYEDWAGNSATPRTWPGGCSWSNADDAWRIHYGYNTRVNWDYGYNDLEKSSPQAPLAKRPRLNTIGPDHDPKTTTPDIGDNVFPVLKDGDFSSESLTLQADRCF
jgi:hypothetical protein